MMVMMVPMMPVSRLGRGSEERDGRSGQDESLKHGSVFPDGPGLTPPGDRRETLSYRDRFERAAPLRVERQVTAASSTG